MTMSNEDVKQLKYFCNDDEVQIDATILKNQKPSKMCKPSYPETTVLDTWSEKI